jgi:Flp pilus assembly pilin Flp
MLNFIKNFRNDEDGAVTVDWVVLTAAIVGLGIAVLTTVGGGTSDLSASASGNIAAVEPINFTTP